MIVHCVRNVLDTMPPSPVVRWNRGWWSDSNAEVHVDGVYAIRCLVAVAVALQRLRDPDAASLLMWMRGT